MKKKTSQLLTRCLNLINQNSLGAAKKLFKRCQKSNRGSIDKLFEEILISVKNKDYELAVRYLVVAYSVDIQEYKSDVLFYLYLLNYFTEIPEEFKKKITELKFDDVKLSEQDTRYSSILYMNQYREQDLKGEFFRFSKTKKGSIYDDLNYILFKRRSKKIGYVVPTIMTCIIIEDYQGVYNIISKEKEKRRISRGLEMIMQLAQVIVNIKNGSYPPVSTEIVEDEYTAVKIGNFDLAFQLRSKRKAREPKVNNDGALRLLKIIIALLNEKKQNIELNICPPIENSNALFENFGNDCRMDLLKFQKYLEQIKKGEYNFLFAGMIKLYSIGTSITKEEIQLTLFQIENSIFTFDLDYYINVFYQMVTKAQYKEAKIYLEIIKQSTNIGIDISTYLLTSLYGMLPEEQIVSTTLNSEDTPAIDSYYYGIPNIEGITKSIIDGGLKVVAVCTNKGLSMEEINYIRLVYAKEYYCMGYYEVGDAFLKAVEKSDHKTPEMIEIIKKIRANKPLYMKQTPGGKLGLKHIFKPNK